MSPTHTHAHTLTHALLPPYKLLSLSLLKPFLQQVEKGERKMHLRVSFISDKKTKPKLE